MITFDKIKIVSNLENIKITNTSRFTKIHNSSENLLSLKYRSPFSYLLYIELAYSRKELIIEFTGKILGTDYPKLINKETIRQCFEHINNLGFCRLNIDALMRADVVKCDVTTDIDCADVPQLTTQIRSNVANFQKHICRTLRNGNFVVEKNVTTRQAKKRLTIYDKEKEMSRAENRAFCLQYPEVDFANKCRFELNLTSQVQIRNSLCISDTSLLNVLNSDACPIRDFLDEVLEDNQDSAIPANNIKTYLKWLLIKECDYDVAKLENKLRMLYPSKGTNLRKVMSPYRQLLATLKNVDVSSFKSGLLGRFCEIIIFIVVAPCLC